MFKRKAVFGIVSAVVLISLAIYFFMSSEDKPIIVLDDAQLEERIEAFVANIRSGGPPPDGIPPIESPTYVSIEEADDYLDDRDVVFLVDYSGEVLVYPQNILVWHEIVNEEIGGEKVSITYCPLTGSGIGFKGSLSAGGTTLGTSGKLLNSNLVMYDRKTDSYWPQVLGMAISGELKGEVLAEFPVIFTRWERIKENYAEAKVLSQNTGFIRDYNSDPYGSYLREGNYYDSGSPSFPVMHSDSRLKDKEVVMAGRSDRMPFAIVKSSVRDRGEIGFEINGELLKAVYDDAFDTVRVFDSQENYVNTFDVFWFAWFAFEPETMLFD